MTKLREHRNKELKLEVCSKLFEPPPALELLPQHNLTRERRNRDRHKARKEQREKKWAEYERKLEKARVRAARKKKEFEDRKAAYDAIFARKQMLAACKGGTLMWRLPKSRFGKPRLVPVRLDTLTNGALIIRFAPFDLRCEDARVSGLLIGRPFFYTPHYLIPHFLGGEANERRTIRLC